MPLDAHNKAVWEQINAQPRRDTLSIDESRQRMAGLTRSYRDALPSEEVNSVEDTLVPGPEDNPIPVRVYRPTTSGPALSTLVYFHGGGFVVGNLDSHDAICRTLANRTPCVVVSVDYRLAPEHPFPAAPEDCYAATQWVAAHAKDLGAMSSQVAVGGDSAGGNLAAAVAIMARERGGVPLALQLLIYPCTDIYDPDAPAFPSYAQFSGKFEGDLLSTDDAARMLSNYMPDRSLAKDKRFAVLRADVKNLPPALVLTAEIDPLRDEGKAFADKLAAAGVPTEFRHFEGTMHGFFSLPVPQREEGMTVAVAALRAAFGIADCPK